MLVWFLFFFLEVVNAITRYRGSLGFYVHRKLQIDYCATRSLKEIGNTCTCIVRGTMIMVSTSGVIQTHFPGAMSYRKRVGKGNIVLHIENCFPTL